MIRLAVAESKEKGAGEERPEREQSARITAEESLRRTREFAAERRERFVAVIRKSQG